MIDRTGPWADVVFMQGDEADKVLDVLCGRDSFLHPVYCGVTAESVDWAVEYLSRWDYGDETDAAHTRETAPWGRGDDVVEHDGYVLAWNLTLGYVSLNRRPLGLSKGGGV